MEITATKTLNLRPIGNIRFTFSKAWKGRQTAKHFYVHIDEVDVYHDTDVSITKEQEQELMSGMMQVSDLLLDSRTGKYYTTRGEKLTQISFPNIHTLNHEEDS